MKIGLILADGRIHKLKVGPLQMSFREAPLTATLLAALTPPELNADVRIFDESVQRIPFHETFDLVGISCLTGTSTRAYEVADRFREKNIPVVLGGQHVTLRPEEAMQHADAIVVGFAEQSWGELLRDFAAGRMKPVYDSDPVNLNHLPHPRRDLQKKFGYMNPNTVFATRGCKSICDFCTVPVARFGWHKRPVGEVVDEIRAIKSNRFVFNDVNLIEDTDYAKELFKALIPLKKIWGGLSSTRLLEEEELMELMHRSGCVYLLIGFESFNNTSLASIHKGFNRAEKYKELMKKLHDYRIVVMGCFIFGFDDDDKNVFKDTTDMVNDLKMDIPRYAVFTPYPNTAAFRKLDAERRLLHYRWEYYDTQHVVFVPNKMTPQELDDGFKRSYKQSFSIRSNLSRTLYSGKNFPITFLGNLAYKIYIKRLFSDENRFPGEILDNMRRMGTP